MSNDMGNAPTPEEVDAAIETMDLVIGAIADGELPEEFADEAERFLCLGMEALAWCQRQQSFSDWIEA